MPDEAIWGYYWRRDIRPEQFWYYHVLFASHIFIALDAVYLRDHVGSSGLMWLGWSWVMCICVSRSVLVHRHTPYVSRKKWMRWPETAVLTCLALLRSTILSLHIQGIDFSTSQQQPGEAGDADRSEVGSVTMVLAVATLVMLVVALLLLLFSFLWSMRERTDSRAAEVVAGVVDTATVLPAKGKLGRRTSFFHPKPVDAGNDSTTRRQSTSVLSPAVRTALTGSLGGPSTAVRLAKAAVRRQSALLGADGRGSRGLSRRRSAPGSATQC